MKMKDLPLRLMQRQISNPRQELLDRLDELQIPKHILEKYASPEDRADAFDGAFTAAQIEIHLKAGASRQEWYPEVLGWYENFHKDVVNSPFYDALETTLAAMKLEDFYRESIDFIIDNKGQL